jgi:hypothetical protein
MHDLLRAYATQLASAEDTADQWSGTGGASARAGDAPG